ncbi:MAG: hypothetical protein HY902_21200 [Deltaproteobacteria bacterium]|nr:hypothetical protein [Deltaproteobacteria bacterium]
MPERQPEYQDPRASPRQQKLQRRIGAAVMVSLALVLVGLQLLRGNHQRDEKLGGAFAELALADAAAPADRPGHWRAAQQQFSHSAAVLTVEPQALLGVALTDGWLQPSGEVPVCLPADVTRQGATEAELLAILKACLQVRQPEQVLAWGQLAGVTRHRGDLALCIHFAAEWQRAREQRLHMKAAKN